MDVAENPTWKSFSKATVPTLTLPSVVKDEEFFQIHHIFPNVWVHLFSYVGGSESIPERPFYSVDWLRVATISSVLPVVLISIACIVSLVLFYHLWKREVPSGSIQRSSVPLISLTVVTYLLLVTGACLALNAGRATYETTHEELLHLAKDLSDVKISMSVINSSTSRVQLALGTFSQCCPPWPFKGMCEASIEGAFGQASTGLRSLHDQLSLANQTVTSLANNIELLNHDDVANGAALLFLTPTLVCIVILTLLVLVAVVVPCLDTNADGAMESSCDVLLFKVGAIPLAFLVFLLVSMSAVAFGTGITTSSFCAEPDDNFLKILVALKEKHGSMVYDATQYYIKGVGTSPAHAPLAKASATLSTFDSWIQDPWFRALLDLLGSGCEPVRTANLPAFSMMAHEQLNKALQLTSREHVVEYYQRAVYRGVCGSVISSIGWLSITYLIAGLVGLPILSVLAHDHLLSFGNGYRPAKQSEVELQSQAPP